MPEAPVVKKVIVIMDTVSGFIPIKQLIKENGFQQKNKDKVLRLGQMDIFIKENSKTVSGAV